MTAMLKLPLTYISSLPNSERGSAVRDAYKAQIPTASFRAMLSAAWNHDHQEVWRAARKELAVLKEWFRDADFEVSHLPDPVTLWRGGVCFRDDQHWETPPSLARGLAWSRQRDVACFFATTWFVTQSRLSGFSNAYPCVVTVTIPRRYCLAHLRERNEDEIIAFTRRLRSHKIDGSDVLVRDVAQFDWRPSNQQVAEWRLAGNPYAPEKAQK
jgi:hypothetical protein